MNETHVSEEGKIEMIIKKEWTVRSFGVVEMECVGWYLFGIIPLYVKKKRLR